MGKEGYKSELTFKNRMMRFIWGIACFVLFRWTPRTFHWWRILVLKCFGAKVGHGVKVYPSVRIWAPWNLDLADGAIVGDRVDCYSVAPIWVGKKTVVSQDSCLCAATHDHRSPDFTLIPKPIKVGDGAWVAARAFVGPGVSIGENAVIGACAVVFRDVSAETIVVGNPARLLHE